MVRCPALDFAEDTAVLPGSPAVAAASPQGEQQCAAVQRGGTPGCDREWDDTLTWSRGHEWSVSFLVITFRFNLTD